MRTECAHPILITDPAVTSLARQEVDLLTAGGQTLSETFQIVKDPRLSYTDQQPTEQFNFLISARDKLLPQNLRESQP